MLACWKIHYCSVEVLIQFVEEIQQDCSNRKNKKQEPPIMVIFEKHNLYQSIKYCFKNQKKFFYQGTKNI